VTARLDGPLVRPFAQGSELFCARPFGVNTDIKYQGWAADDARGSVRFQAPYASDAAEGFYEEIAWNIAVGLTA